jgi:serine/threonine protein kinase
MLNQQFGNYKFLSILGEGGMATVYLAENTMLGSLVAIKVLKEDFVSNKNVRSRFLDEAKKMVRVKHPNIIQVYDLIDAGDIVAIVMEYIEGQSLKDLIENQGKMSQIEIERLFPQILLALQHVHKAGFVHRDIKPSNFMLSTDGTIKLADFGIAKDKNVAAFTETGTQMGTPMYMSPEQIKSTRDVDHRSDIYSLGVVLYEMATGTFPFDKNNLSMPEIQVCILRDSLPTTGSLWDGQIAKATAKNEIDRFQSCNDWLENFAKNEQPSSSDKPTERKTEPISQATTYSSGSSDTNYDTNQKRYLFIGVGVIVFICFLAFMFWPEKKVEVVGDAISSKNIINLTHQELLSKNIVQMDNLILKIKEGSQYKCDDCKLNYLIENKKYQLEITNNIITAINEISHSDSIKSNNLNNKSIEEAKIQLIEINKKVEQDNKSKPTESKNNEKQVTKLPMPNFQFLSLKNDLNINFGIDVFNSQIIFYQLNLNNSVNQKIVHNINQKMKNGNPTYEDGLVIYRAEESGIDTKISINKSQKYFKVVYYSRHTPPDDNPYDNKRPGTILTPVKTQYYYF